MPKTRRYIDHRPDIANGRAILRDTRIEVREIALEYEYYGWTVDQIIETYPRLTRAQIHAALAHYYENQAEIDAELAAKQKHLESISGKYGNKIELKSVALTTVWVFDGPRNHFPSGVFATYEAAHEWITKNSLTGVLTEYPVNISVYEWCIKAGFFWPKREEHFSPEFIESFSSSSQDHYHYENGSGGRD